MPRPANLEMRIAWHLEHAAACSCRPIPPRLMAELAQRGGPAQIPDPHE